MVKIKRIGVLKMASFMGIYGAFIGLITGILLSLVLFLIPSEFGSLVKGGFLSIILYPIFYGIGGFIGGFIITPIINLALKIIKGLDLDIEMDHSSSRTQISRQPRVQRNQNYR